MVRGRRFACTHCCRVWRQEASTLAEPRVRLTRLVVEWRLRALGCESVSVSWVAAALGVAWYATTSRGPDLGRADPQRGARPIQGGGGSQGLIIPRALRSHVGGAPSVWRHTRRGDRYARRGHRHDPRARSQWSGSASGRGPGSVLEGPQDLARRSGRVLAWVGRGGGDGRFHRFQERCRPGAPTGPGGHGSLRASCPWLAASSMSTAVVSNERSRAGGAGRVTGLPGQAHPADRGWSAHRRPGRASRDPVRR